jgi:hypothetical protein
MDSFFKDQESFEKFLNAMSKKLGYEILSPFVKDAVSKIAKDIAQVLIEYDRRLGKETLKERDARLEMSELYEDISNISALMSLMKKAYEPEFNELDDYAILLEMGLKLGVFKLDMLSTQVQEWTYEEGRTRLNMGRSVYEVPAVDFLLRTVTDKASAKACYERWLMISDEDHKELVRKREEQMKALAENPLTYGSYETSGEVSLEEEFTDFSSIPEPTDEQFKQIQTWVNVYCYPKKSDGNDNDETWTDSTAGLGLSSGKEVTVSTERASEDAQENIEPKNSIPQEEQKSMSTLNELNSLTAGAQVAGGQAEVAAKPKEAVAAEASISGAQAALKATAATRANFTLTHNFARLIAKYETTSKRIVDPTKGYISSDPEKAKAQVEKMAKAFAAKTGYIEGRETTDPTQMFPRVHSEDYALAIKILHWLEEAKQNPTAAFKVYQNEAQLPVICGVELDGKFYSNTEIAPVIQNDAYGEIFGVGQLVNGTPIDKACSMTIKIAQKNEKRSDGSRQTVNKAQATYTIRTLCKNRREFVKDASHLIYLFPTADKSNLATGEITKEMTIVADIEGAAASIRVRKFDKAGNPVMTDAKTVNGQAVDPVPKYERFTLKLHTEVLLTDPNPDKAIVASVTEADQRFNTTAVGKTVVREAVTVNYSDKESFADDKVLQAKLNNLANLMAVAAENRLEGAENIDVKDVKASAAAAFNASAEKATADVKDLI